MSVDVDDKIPRKLIGDELRLVQILNNLYHKFAGFQLCEIKDIIDDRQHIVTAAEDNIKRLLLSW